MAAQPLSIRRSVAETPNGNGMVIGTLIAVTAEGCPIVRFPGGAAQGNVAKVASSDAALADAQTAIGIKLALVFENADPTLPVIVGVLRDTLPAPVSSHAKNEWMEKGQSLTVNGRKLVFDGQEEIVFRCGQGSITLRADGSIVAIRR